MPRIDKCHFPSIFRYWIFPRKYHLRADKTYYLLNILENHLPGAVLHATTVLCEVKQAPVACCLIHGASEKRHLDERLKWERPVTFHNVTYSAFFVDTMFSVTWLEYGIYWLSGVSLNHRRAALLLMLLLPFSQAGVINRAIGRALPKSLGRIVQAG